MAAGVVSAPNLTRLRKDNQSSRVYLTLHSPVTVYSARLATLPDDNDQVTQIGYYLGVGTLGDVKEDMTLWVGTSAGSFDKGQVRIRLQPDASYFYVSEASDIAWSVNDYLTVVDEFVIWPRHMRILDNVFLVDWDIPYSDQHADPDPVPVMGPHCPLMLGAGGLATAAFEASGSWRVYGGVITYTWSAPGATSTTGAGTATFTASYATPGTYRVSLTVTVGGKSFTGYRYVFVYSDLEPPTTDFTVGGCSGDNQGGYSFRVSLYDPAIYGAVRDRALVLLWAEDWYGDEKISIGPLAGREGLIAYGWIATESITWNPEQTIVEFEVQGPHWWLNKITGFPVGILDVQTTPAKWTEFQNLTVDKGLYHLLRFRTTALRSIDTSLTGDTRLVASTEAPLGSLWQQLVIYANIILAAPHCDRFGMLYVEFNPQYIAVVSRGAFPEVVALTSADLRAGISVQRTHVNDTALVELQGVSFDGAQPIPFLSLSPGYSPKHYGSTDTIDRLALSGQDQANELSGLILGNKNNPYQALNFPLAANARILDFAPNQYFVADLPDQAGVRFIPRRVSYVFNAEAGTILVDVEGEAETFPELSVTKPVPPVDPSGEGGDPDPDDMPGDDPVPLPEAFDGLVYVVTSE